MIMYIPVDEATLGGTPKLRSRGLKIDPPPRPKAPETQPPMNEIEISFTIFSPSNLTSEVPKPVP